MAWSDFESKLWRPHPTEWTKEDGGLRWSNVSTKTTCVDWSGIIEHGSKPGASVIEMSSGNLCIVGLNIPSRIGEKWMHKHHLDVDE